MFKNASNKDDSQLGIGVAAKANVDMGFKAGLDILFVTDKGINSLSPYYDNGLYIFGNKLDFDGTWQHGLHYSPVTNSKLMSVAVNGSYPFSKDVNLFGALGMVSKDDPVGSELNVGCDYLLMDGLHWLTVGAAGQTGKAIDASKNHFVYMLGTQFRADY